MERFSKILKIILVIGILCTLMLGIFASISAHIVEVTVPTGYDVAVCEQLDQNDVYEVNTKIYYWKDFKTGEKTLLKYKVERTKVS